MKNLVGLISVFAAAFNLLACKTTSSSPLYASFGATTYDGCDASASFLLSSPTGKLRALAMSLQSNLKPVSGLVLVAVGEGHTRVGDVAKDLGVKDKDEDALFEIHQRVMADESITCCGYKWGEGEAAFQASKFADEAGKQLTSSDTVTPAWLAEQSDRLFDLLSTISADELPVAGYIHEALGSGFDKAGTSAVPFMESHVLNGLIIAAGVYFAADADGSERAANELKDAVYAAVAFANQPSLPKQTRPSRRGHLVLVLSQIGEMISAKKNGDKKLLASVNAAGLDLLANTNDKLRTCLQLVHGSERALTMLAYLGAEKSTLQGVIDSLIAKSKACPEEQAGILVPAWTAAKIYPADKEDNVPEYRVEIPDSYLGAAAMPMEVLGEPRPVLPVPSPSDLLLRQFGASAYPDFTLTRAGQR